MIPYFGQKLSNFKTLSQTELLESHKILTGRLILTAEVAHLIEINNKGYNN